MLDAHILDWYHFKEHVVTTSQVVYGESTKQASQWQSQMLETAWDQGSFVMLHRLGAYERRHTDERREALGSLRGYIEPRSAQTDYPSFRAQGYDCGSGPTESQCGSLTSRVKGPGMRWDRENVQAMLALAALDHSNLWNAYWQLVNAFAFAVASVFLVVHGLGLFEQLIHFGFELFEGLGHMIVTHGLVLGRVGLDLGAVQRDMAQLDQSGFLA